MSMIHDTYELPAITDIDISEEGDAIGLQISALVQLSLHF